MNWAVLLVVCEVVAYRPELPPRLALEDPPCRQVDAQELCELKLEAEECLHITDLAASRGKRGKRRGRGKGASRSAACALEGPEEGFAVLYGVSNETDAVSLRGEGPWQISGGIHFHRLRLEVTALEVENARLAFFNTSARKDGGAISAGRGGLKLRNSSLQVVSSNATRGGAIAVSSRGQLRCEGSTIVTESSYARMDGGSIFAKNVRLENSSVQISYAWARNGGGLLADMLVARSSSLSISNAFAYGHGGATYSHKRLVLIDSRLRGRALDASQTLASKGGGIYAFHLELRNSSVEIEDAASGFDGSCIHAVRSMALQGSAVHLSGCRAKSQAALHVGGEVQMVNSSMTCHNSSAQSSGALHAEKVFLNSSTMKMTQIRSQVPPVALEVSVFKMEGSSALSLLGTGGHQGFSAIELSSKAHENRSFDMSQDSSLVITDFFSGILSDGGLVRLRNARLQRLRYAVEMPRAEGLDVADSVLEDVSELAFSCGSCQHLALRRIVARRVGALLRAAELKKWSLRDVQARCSQRSQVACVQLASALVFLDPEPWRLENVSLEAENVSSDVAPVLLDVEGPKVKGSHITVSATCPAGSFSFTQESGSSISKTAELMAMFEIMRGAENSPASNGTACCASTRTLPRTQRFLKRTFDFDFGIIPDMNISCDPATYPCVCTTNICDRQILKTSLVSTRVSCMSCPMGQYSLTPYLRTLKGDDSGLLGSSGRVLEGDCLSCTDVVTQVGKMPICAGRSVRVPRGLMALPGTTQHGLRFYRCPNAGACPGGDMVVADNLTRNQRCAGGYDDASAGCSQCATGYGRQNLDPFECVRCGRWDLSLAYFLLLPVVPLLLAVRSASQTEKERMSMVIKVILSFGTFLATIQNILEQTAIYRELRTQLTVALGLLEAESEAGGATLLSASFDCLMGGHASRWHFLGLQTFHFLAFLLIFLVLEIVGLLSRSESFGASWLRRTLVLGNAFLPQIFASCLQWAPCFHMAKDETDGSFESFSVFQVTETCGSGFGMPWMPLLGLSLFLLLGPLHWAFMVSQSRKWKNRKEYIGFLIAGYNLHCEWWEITVLLRKTFLIGALVVLPVSYAPISLVIATVLIMLAALVGHLAMRPYVDPLMNLLEGGVLTYSMLALILTLYLMSESWTNTNKTLVFFILVGSNAVMCLLLLVVFLVIALRRPRQESSARSTATSSVPAG